MTMRADQSVGDMQCVTPSGDNDDPITSAFLGTGQITWYLLVSFITNL
jgi:hypothetical protein